MRSMEVVLSPIEVASIVHALVNEHIETKGITSGDGFNVIAYTRDRKSLTYSCILSHNVDVNFMVELRNALSKLHCSHWIVANEERKIIFLIP